MTDLESLLHLLAYNEWANRESLRSVQSATSALERTHALISHVVGTERVWLERARQSGKPTVVWPDWTLDQTAREISDSADAWRELLVSTDLTSRVHYTNSRGEHFDNSIADIAMHMLFHGTYHRGQIAALLRQSGSEPAYTDYIHYVRSVA